MIGSRTGRLHTWGYGSRDRKWDWIKGWIVWWTWNGRGCDDFIRLRDSIIWRINLAWQILAAFQNLSLVPVSHFSTFGSVGHFVYYFAFQSSWLISTMHKLFHAFIPQTIFIVLIYSALVKYYLWYFEFLSFLIFWILLLKVFWIVYFGYFMLLVFYILVIFGIFRYFDFYNFVLFLIT